MRRVTPAPNLAPLLLALAIFLCGLLPASAHSASHYAPELTWSTLTTAHFYIHYHDELEADARQFAHIAEAVHLRQIERLNWQPKGRTHVVVSDQSDFANGSATPLPYNTIRLSATPPSGDTDLLLNPERWRYMLLLHEYTHILHLDRAAGLPLTLRSVFGRHPLLFPNIFNPPWLIEGLATYEETRGTNAGRGRGALSRGLLRTQALESKLMPISVASHPIARWPGGTTRYLYGVEFLEYLADQHGDAVIERMLAEYSDNLFPFLLNSSFKRATGSDITVAWNAWRTQLEHDSAAENFFGPVAEQLTHSGFGTGGARANKGGRIAFSQATPHDHTQIRLLAADGTSTKLAWRNGGRGMAWLNDSQLLIAQPEVFQHFKIYNDLYLLDADTGHSRRLTHGARLSDPDVGPDGTIVAVARGIDGMAGGTALVKMAGPDASPQPLLVMSQETIFADPRISPDGATVAVSAYGGGHRDIYLVDLTSGAERRITKAANNASPAWGPWGRYLLYSSDQTGTFNLFAWDAARNHTYQITDLAGGAFAPEVVNGPDGSHIVYSGLAADGFDLYRIPFDPNRWRMVSTKIAPIPPATPAVPQTEVTGPTPYHPYPAALPKVWAPLAYEKGNQSFLGLFTYGSDPLGHHLYTAELAADLDHARLEGDLLYIYDRWRPTVRLRLLQRDIGRVIFNCASITGLCQDFIRERIAIGDILVPFNRVNQRQRLLLGLSVEDIRDGCHCIRPQLTPFLRLGAHHNSSQRYRYGISPTDGQRIGLTGEVAMPLGGNHLSGNAFALNWSGFKRLPWPHQVLSLELDGVIAQGDVAASVGGKPRVDEDAFVRKLSLPGYPTRAFVGDRAGRAGVSYRFPLGVTESGYKTVPLFLEKLHGKLSAQVARIRHLDGHNSHAASYSASVGSDIAIAYALPLTITAGVARGTSRLGETQYYLRLDGDFVGL